MSEQAAPYGAPEWTPVKIRLSCLDFWEDNPKPLSKAQAKRLEHSSQDLGRAGVLLVSPDTAGRRSLYDGHQRAQIWRALYGADAEIWALESNRPLEYKERQAVSVMTVLATGSFDWQKLSGWDADALKGWGADADTLKAWNFDANNLKEFLRASDPDPVDAEPQVDRAAELNEKWQVKTGDLWRIGDHLLLCGDSTVRADVERVMGGERAGVVIADAPYGMNLDTDFSGMTSSSSFGNGKKHDKVIGDEAPFCASAVVGCDCKEQFWFGADYYAKSLGDTEQTGSWLVWDKRITESADLMYGSCFELIWSKQKHKRDILRHKWAGFFTGGKERTFSHPTEKPAELIIDLITISGDVEVIYDPFCGSGPSVVASQNLNRKCRAIEISESYCAVILERMSQAFPDLTIERID